MRVWIVDNKVSGERHVYGTLESALDVIEDKTVEPFKGFDIEVGQPVIGPRAKYWLRNHGNLVGDLQGCDVLNPVTSSYIKEYVDAMLDRACKEAVDEYRLTGGEDQR